MVVLKESFSKSGHEYNTQNPAHLSAESFSISKARRIFKVSLDSLQTAARHALSQRMTMEISDLATRIRRIHDTPSELHGPR